MWPEIKVNRPDELLWILAYARIKQKCFLVGVIVPLSNNVKNQYLKDKVISGLNLLSFTS
jgi:hypothetical protein